MTGSGAGSRWEWDAATYDRVADPHVRWGDDALSRLRLTGDDWSGPWTFATAEGTRARLERAGFRQAEVWLQPEPTPLEAGEPLETYLETVCLGAHLERLPAGERRAFVRDVAARLPRPEIDYVRLNIVAERD
jgi:trans-aconitate 2-methyltransferase